MTWLGFQARFTAILHKIRHPRHKMLWRYYIDQMCDGDILCETCNKTFWCRAHDLPDKEAERRLAETKTDVSRIVRDLRIRLSHEPFQDLSDVGNIIGMVLGDHGIEDSSSDGNDIIDFQTGVSHGLDLSRRNQHES